MRLRIADHDLWSGVVFVAIGIAALAFGADLTMGTAADMGEGYVPRAMAVALLGFGTLLIVLTLRRGLPASESSAASGEDGFRWRPLAFVTLAVIAFAVALEPLGLIAATALSAVAANFAGRPLRARALVLLILVLAALVATLFVWGLGLPLHLLPR